MRTETTLFEHTITADLPVLFTTRASHLAYTTSLSHLLRVVRAILTAEQFPGGNCVTR